MTIRNEILNPKNVAKRFQHHFSSATIVFFFKIPSSSSSSSSSCVCALETMRPCSVADEGLIIFGLVGRYYQCPHLFCPLASSPLHTIQSSIMTVSSLSGHFCCLIYCSSFVLLLLIISLLLSHAFISPSRFQFFISQKVAPSFRPKCSVHHTQ